MLDKCTFVLLILVPLIAGSSILTWQEFKMKYEKHYDSLQEELRREKIYLENIQRMQEYRKLHSDATFTVGINHLMDRHYEEFKTNEKFIANLRSSNVEKSSSTIEKNIPDQLDWREKNVVNPVYDQGMAVKDAFIAAVEVIDSYQAIQSKRLEQGSVDQVASCCDNALDIFDCIRDKLDGAICRQQDFNSTVVTKCDRKACQPYARFNRIKKLADRNETTMLNWIQDSTLFVGIDASQAGFLLYIGGVYSDDTCSQDTIDHVIQVVGYGSDAGVPYWLCKNSWGKNWGDQGYIRIERGKNTCAIAQLVVQVEYQASSAVEQSHMLNFYLIILCLISWNVFRA